MSTKRPIDLSVVILNYNTKELTRACLTSVYQSTLSQYSMEVIVCDNASTDGSLDMVKEEFPQVTRIQNGKNVGFAVGNNPGIRKAAGRYVLLLNSDTEVPKDTFEKMISFMDQHKDAGAATCKLLLPDGTMDPACHRGFPTPWVAFTYVTKLERLFPHSRLFGEYHQTYKDLTRVHEVDCIVGAFFMIRRETLTDVGLLDEEYFMYGEDIDWAYRIRTKGWKILFNPAVTILHKKKQSGRANKNSARRIQTEIYFHTYNWLFYRKHYERAYGPLVSFLVGVYYRMKLSGLKRKQNAL